MTTDECEGRAQSHCDDGVHRLCGDCGSVADMIPRHSRRATAEALFSLSQTQRRLAHRAREEARKAEAEGSYRWFAHYEKEARRLWREAKSHFEWARREFWELEQ